MIKPIEIKNAEVVELNNGQGHYIQIGDEIFAVNGCLPDGHPGRLRWRIIPGACSPSEKEVVDYFSRKRPGLAVEC